MVAVLGYNRLCILSFYRTLSRCIVFFDKASVITSLSNVCRYLYSVLGKNQTVTEQNHGLLVVKSVEGGPKNKTTPNYQ